MRGTNGLRQGIVELPLPERCTGIALVLVDNVAGPAIYLRLSIKDNSRITKLERPFRWARELNKRSSGGLTTWRLKGCIVLREKE